MRTYICSCSFKESFDDDGEEDVYVDARRTCEDVNGRRERDDEGDGEMEVRVSGEVRETFEEVGDMVR